MAVKIGLVVAVLVAAGGLGFLHLKLNQVPRLDLGDALTDEPRGRSAQNYLLVGTDSAVGLDPGDPVTIGREGLGTLADTIMVLRIDPDSPQAQLLSFPRDLYVSIPGEGEAKINSALARGGQEALIATVEDNFGIPVHHYVQVDFLGFEELVRAVDGVPIYFATPVRDPSTGLFVGHGGCVTLSPEQALAYARSRHLEYREDGEWISDASADFGRISRQQDFIRLAIRRAVVEGVRDPLLLGSFFDVATEAVQVDRDLSVDDVVQLGLKFRSFGDDTLQTLTLDVVDDVVDGEAVLRLQDTEANARHFDVFRGVGGAGSQQAPGISVAVRNGTGTDGEATAVGEGLDRLGFDTSPGTGDAESFEIDHTVVRYTAGHEAQARFVAAQLEGDVDVEEVDDLEGADVVVVTGADFDGVTDELQAPPVPLGGDGGGGGGGGGGNGGSPPIGEVPTREPPPQADC